MFVLRIVIWLIGAPRRPPRSSFLLRHPLHGAPALERGPDSAFEPEAVDRHGRAERPDAAQTDAGPLEAALLEHPARCRIGDAHRGLQRLVLRVGERVIDQRADRFGGVTLAPVASAKPVA